MADLDSANSLASPSKSTSSCRDTSFTSAVVYWVTHGESCIMSAGSTASAPYTRKNGVYPVDLFGVVLRLHSTADSSSIQHPADLCRGSTSRGFIPDNTSPLDLSTCPLDVG